MSLIRLSTLALATISASAQIIGDSALTNICQPVDSSNQFDWNAPCNALMSIQYECMYGPSGRDLISAPGESSPEDIPAMQPYQAQRACICQSQHNDMLDGCMKCLKSHGGVEGEDWFSESKIEPLMEGYCNAESPATQNYAYLFYYSLVDGDKTAASSSTSTGIASLPSTVANATDVSLYFTPSITGSPAYIPAMPTPQSSGGNVTYTSLKTSGGLIVPTASLSENESEDEGTASVTTSSEAGAMPSITVHPDLMRALGLAAVFAAL